MLLVALAPVAAFAEAPTWRDQVRKVGLKAAALRPKFLAKHRPSYRVTVPLARQDNAIRDQKSSGRCWLFATAAVLSNKVVARRGGTAPTFSVSFLNHHSLRKQAFGVIDHALGAKKDQTWRVKKIGEGGFLPFAMQIVREHGLVPEEVMPSTAAKAFDADSSGVLLSQIKRLTTAATTAIATAPSTGAGSRDKLARTYKRKVVELLDLALGEPPTHFSVANKRYTPDAYRKALGLADRDLRYVSLFNQPHKTGERITIEDKTGGFFDISARPLKSRQLRRIAQGALDAGEALYFAANAGSKNPHRIDDKTAPAGSKGILSVGAFNYRGLVQMTPLSKRARLEADIDSANHAMVLTGYDTRGKSRNVRKWRVDNSWGTKKGDEGRFHMYNDYFGAYVERLFVPEHLVPKKLR